MTSRPILVGMNNPQGNEALVPYPSGCTGHRIWAMLSEKTGCFRKEYMDTFERMNVVEVAAYSAAAARARREVVWSILEGRTVVLLGRAVCAALGVRETPWMAPQRVDNTTIYQLPHPSGLNRWYNESEKRPRRCWRNFTRPIVAV